MCAPAVHLELVTKINRADCEHLVKWFTCRWRSMQSKSVKWATETYPGQFRETFTI